MTFFKAFRLDRSSESLPTWNQLRDNLFKKLLDKAKKRNNKGKMDDGDQSDLDKVVDLSIKFEAKQIFVSAVFTGGPAYYDILQQMISKWEPNFLFVAFKVAYVLETRKIQR